MYVGSTGTCVRNRIGHHICKLRAGRHHSTQLQDEWNASVESDWEVVLLETGVFRTTEQIRQRELDFIDKALFGVYNLNDRFTLSEGNRWSLDTRARISESRARYPDTPGARQRLSEQARRQHQEGKLGRGTWNGRSETRPDLDRLLRERNK